MIITLFDIIILTIIAFSSVFGIYEGLIGLVIRFLGFIASVILSFVLYPYIVNIISEYLQDALIQCFLSSIFSYIFSLVICGFITHKLLTILTILRGGFFDRLFGLMAGLLRGLIISLIIFEVIIIVTSTSFIKSATLYDLLKNIDYKEYPQWLKNSKTTNYFDKLHLYTTQLLPENELKSIKLFTNETPDESAETPLVNESLGNKKISDGLQEELNEVLSRDGK